LEERTCQQQLQEENEKLKRTLLMKEKEIKSLTAENVNLKKQLQKQQPFTVLGVRKREKCIKNLFKYYTGLTYVNFLCLLTFLFPDVNSKINFGRSDTKHITNESALFLLVCRLRHNFRLKDLAVRFGLSLQSTGTVFNIFVR